MCLQLRVLAFALSAAATSFSQATVRSSASDATIYVYRQKIVRLSRVLPWVFVTGNTEDPTSRYHPSDEITFPGNSITFPGTSFGLVAKMVNGRYIKMYVRPDKYTVRAWFLDVGKKVKAFGSCAVGPYSFLCSPLGTHIPGVGGDIEIFVQDVDFYAKSGGSYYVRVQMGDGPKGQNIRLVDAHVGSAIVARYKYLPGDRIMAKNRVVPAP